MTDLSESFNKVSKNYARYRSDYPSETISTIFEIANLEISDRICEIGCGTGQASLALAGRGHPIICIEPGIELARIVERKLEKFPRVTVINSKFEDAELQANEFGLVVSAQAFHWISHSLKYKKTADVLRPGGVLIAFWRSHIPDHKNIVQSKINELVEKTCPNFSPESLIDYEKANSTDFKELLDSNYFVGCEFRRYPYEYQVTAKQYTNSVGTFSHIAALPSEQRDFLLQQIFLTIEQAGGLFRSKGETRFLVGRKPS